MRMKATWLLASAGVAMIASTSAFADYARTISITAEYQVTDNLGNPINGAGGQPQIRQVTHEFTIGNPNTGDTSSDFRYRETDSLGTMWFEYVGSTRSFGDLPTAANNPSFSGGLIGIREDPMVVANFTVSAGIVNTTFTTPTSSNLLSFPAITNGVAIASAAISVTDSAGFGDIGSVSITGLQPGGNAYAARFNGGSQTFANLISSGSVSIAPGSTHTFVGQSASFPAYDNVSGTVTDMDSQFRFTLSRFDRAAGTSTFEIIPAPGAAALIALGGLAAARRRRTV